VDIGVLVHESTIEDIRKVTDWYFNDEIGRFCKFRHCAKRVVIIPYGWEHIGALEGNTLESNGLQEINPFVAGFRSL
jgi:hypothetical protein